MCIEDPSGRLEAGPQMQHGPSLCGPGTVAGYQGPPSVLNRYLSHAHMACVHVPTPTHLAREVILDCLVSLTSHS